MPPAAAPPGGWPMAVGKRAHTSRETREIRLDEPAATVPPSLPPSAQCARPLSPGQPRPDGDGRGLRHDRAAHRPLPALRQPADAARGAPHRRLRPLLWLAAFQAFGLYAPQHLSPPEEFRRTFGAASVGIVLLVVTSYRSHSSFSRVWMGATWVLALLLELLSRRGWRRYQFNLKRSGRLSFRTLIVGTSAEAGRLAHVLDSPGSGFVPSGTSTGPKPASRPTPCPCWASWSSCRR
jgi:hypothetical protein